MKMYKALLFLLNVCLTFYTTSSVMCSQLVGKSGKIILYPECNSHSYLELNIDYVRELDQNNKKIAKHFKENIASTDFTITPLVHEMVGSPPVNTTKYNLTTCLLQNKGGGKNKNNCVGELFLETYFFSKNTTFGLMNVSDHSMKFNIIINNWVWENPINTLEVGIDLSLNGFSNHIKNNTHSDNLIDLDFESFSYKTPTKNGAYCGENPQLCDVLFELQRVPTSVSPSPSPSGSVGPSPVGPSPSDWMGPSPSSNYVNTKYKLKYTFPYFGNRLVYDPVVSSNTKPNMNTNMGTSTGMTTNTTNTNSNLNTNTTNTTTNTTKLDVPLLVILCCLILATATICVIASKHFTNQQNNNVPNECV